MAARDGQFAIRTIRPSTEISPASRKALRTNCGIDGCVGPERLRYGRQGKGDLWPGSGRSSRCSTSEARSRRMASPHVGCLDPSLSWTKRATIPLTTRQAWSNCWPAETMSALPLRLARSPRSERRAETSSWESTESVPSRRTKFSRAQSMVNLANVPRQAGARQSLSDNSH